MLKSAYTKDLIEAGCDEAGRGCLAGPVFAAAVILPKNYKNKTLNDSKQLSESKRDALRIEIEKDAMAWAVMSVSPKKIDEINILNASFLAMHLALEQLPKQPELILVDGNRFTPYNFIPHVCVVKGDGKYLSIAAASILAKTHRDEYMLNQHKKHPNYGWDTNKGYPTIKHRNAVKEYGFSPIHRKTFKVR